MSTIEIKKHQEHPGEKPRFGDRELWVGNTLIKKFRHPAPDQILILNSFEEQKWPREIDDPLPPIHGGDAKRRLRQTIYNLNHLLDVQGVIRFYGNGTGQGIGWKWCS
jgi:hypothetical protein